MHIGFDICSQPSQVAGLMTHREDEPGGKGKAEDRRQKGHIGGRRQGEGRGTEMVTGTEADTEVGQSGKVESLQSHFTGACGV